jgi:S1-C subfamily serine protease
MKQEGAKTIFAPFLFYDFHPESSCATMAWTRVDEAPMTSVRTTQTRFLLFRYLTIPFLLLVIVLAFGGLIAHAEPSIGSVPSYEKSLSVPAVVAKVRPSVVTILTRGMPTTPTQAQSGSGSGVIIDESGYILTNNHLVAGIKSLVVGLSTGRLTPGRVVARDFLLDLALVKITAMDLVPATLNPTPALEIGESVVAIGNPLALKARPSRLVL